MRWRRRTGHAQQRQCSGCVQQSAAVGRASVGKAAAVGSVPEGSAVRHCCRTSAANRVRCCATSQTAAPTPRDRSVSTSCGVIRHVRGSASPPNSCRSASVQRWSLTPHAPWPMVGSRDACTHASKQTNTPARARARARKTNLWPRCHARQRDHANQWVPRRAPQTRSPSNRTASSSCARARAAALARPAGRQWPLPAEGRRLASSEQERGRKGGWVGRGVSGYVGGSAGSGCL